MCLSLVLNCLGGGVGLLIDGPSTKSQVLRDLAGLHLYQLVIEVTASST